MAFFYYFCDTIFVFMNVEELDNLKVLGQEESKKLQLIDPNTGEIIELEDYEGKRITIKPTYTPKPQNGNFIILWQDVIKELIFNVKLTKNDYQVLLYLFSSCSKDNQVQTSNALIADLLHLQKTHVCTSLKKLEKLNIITQLKIMGGSKIITIQAFQVNPNLAYRGAWTNKDFGKALAKAKPLKKNPNTEELLMPEDEKKRLLDNPTLFQEADFKQDIPDDMK